MKKPENIFQKIFAGIGFTGSSRVPIRSNVFNSGGRAGFSKIGQTGRRMFDNDRNSPLLGNAQPSNRLSGFYDRVSELKGYQLLDVTKLAVGLFRDYVINFLIKDSKQLISIQNEDGSTNQTVTERINNILTEQLKVIDFIKDHVEDSIFFGTYCSLLKNERDETGHLVFRLEELYDPVSVIVKRKKNKEGIMEEIFLARGDDGNLYEIPRNEGFLMGSTNLRLINDLSDDFDSKHITPKLQKGKKNTNLEKVLKKESYMSGEPLFYANILKVKELVVKEILISLLSLRDLSSPSLYGLAIDKGVSLEVANDLCAKLQKLSTNEVELASFLTAQFDITSFIESSLTQTLKVFPDYAATLTNKNSLLPLDKLSDKLLEIMQTVDQCRQSVLSPLGIPTAIYDSATGSKWAILQQSERANSRVATIMAGIDGSLVDLVATLYRKLYDEELNIALIKTHIFERSTVEYNNQINQAESINSLIQGVSNVIQSSVQTLDTAGPLLDIKAYLSYVQTLIKDIDPTSGTMITEDTINAYVEWQTLKLQSQRDQLGM